MASRFSAKDMDTAVSDGSMPVTWPFGAARRRRWIFLPPPHPISRMSASSWISTWDSPQRDKGIVIKFIPLYIAFTAFSLKQGQLSFVRDSIITASVLYNSLRTFSILYRLYGHRDNGTLLEITHFPFSVSFSPLLFRQSVTEQIAVLVYTLHLYFHLSLPPLIPLQMV